MLGDEALFFRTWATNPLKLGAVSPSSRALARLMVEHARPDPAGFTLELGPGTGVVTQALIDYGVPAERIIAVEHNGEFCRLLQKRFPRLTSSRATLSTSTRPCYVRWPFRFSAALSGLPLLSFPKRLRLKCIDGVLDRMLPGKGPGAVLLRALSGGRARRRADRGRQIEVGHVEPAARPRVDLSEAREHGDATFAGL